jgi:outer membrane protein
VRIRFRTQSRTADRRPRTGFNHSAIAVVLVLGFSVVHAQDAPPAQPPAPVLPARVGVENGQPLSLSLADAIKLTLEQNNDVTIARLELDASRQDIRLAEGVYDPRVLNAISFQRTVNANASAIGGAVNGRLEQDLFAGSVGLDGLSPWGGGRYTFDFTSSRNETSNQFARLNPQFPAALSVSFAQPLVRGRSMDAERRQIQLARRAVDLTDRQLLQVLMDQLTLVEQAYWDLVFAASNLDVQATALAQAESQVASNERQARQGTLAPIDVVEAQTQVSTFRYSVASAQQALTEAENRLKTLMLANRQAEEWNRPIVPADVNERADPGLALPEAVKLAMDRRPELAAIDTQRAQNEIDRAYFSDQAKPQLDVVGTYTLSGLAGGALQGTTNPISGDDAALLARLNDLSERAGLTPLQSTPQTGTSVPNFLVGNYSESLGNLFSRRYPTALVQLQMELPIGNTAARANLARTRIEANQITRRREQMEQAIEAEVRNTLQAVRSSQQRLDAAASARRNALEQYESERRRFESGLSTVFLVLERQQTLVTAQAAQLRARADLNQAAALLERAVGGTLERHGIALTTR